jgi:hypothetical protein
MMAGEIALLALGALLGGPRRLGVMAATAAPARSREQLAAARRQRDRIV